MEKVFSLHYLPCIQWFREFGVGASCVIDVHEHFVKQTYRNRTNILSANGRLTLTVPVKKKAHHMPISEVEIDNEVNWQHQHWQTIVSAYNSAPYFLYYQDYFKSYFEKEYASLADWNSDLLGVCFRLLKLEPVISKSEKYVEGVEEANDFRKIISPKVKTEVTGKPYLQVFSEKYPFEPNLSIIDTLFNHGPRWAEYVY